MGVDWNAEIVDQVESHWVHQLRPRLVGMTDDEYFWKPAPNCWTISRRGLSTASHSFGGGDFTWDYGAADDVDPMTTIAWRLGHIIVGLAETNGTHFGRPPAAVASFSYAGTADEALGQLDDEFGHWIEGVRSLGEEGLARPQGSISPPEFADAPIARLIMFASVEIVHHGAEVCLLRDLYRQSQG